MGSFAPVVPLVAALILGYLTLRWYLTSSQKPALRTVAILVLGDVGRSPRMMYHAESFAQNGFKTYIIGNRGADRSKVLALNFRTTLIEQGHLPYRLF